MSMKRWFKDAREISEKHIKDKYGMSDLVGVMTGLVVLGVVGMVGLYILNEVSTIASITAGSQFATASSKVTSIIETGFGLMLIAVLALIAGVIIAYLTGAFGRSR